MSLMAARNAVHVEVCVKADHLKCQLNVVSKLEEPLRYYIANRQLPINEPIHIEEGSEHNLNQYVELFILECDDKKHKEFITAPDMEHLVFHFYWPFKRSMEQEMFDNEAGDAEAVPSSNHWLLPSSDFLGLWENLIYEPGLKEKLLKYALSALTFSQHKINQNIICCNRLILLHGPPGTGKTSLCKAVAQKLSIRTRSIYKHTHLIEINSHSLFSKWFSESGKLVMRLFAKIREIILDPNNLVCVLIDEVESLAYARSCMTSQEPKDAMRVVNALLTQLDSIKEHPNVLILATSNLAETIDMAFLDRADIKQYIGLPSIVAIRHIYIGMLHEMMRVGILQQESLSALDKHEDLLNALAERSIGLSGRTLRKLPFLAHVIHNATAQNFHFDDKITLSDFLDALLLALEKHQTDQESMKFNCSRYD